MELNMKRFLQLLAALSASALLAACGGDAGVTDAAGNQTTSGTQGNLNEVLAASSSTKTMAGAVEKAGLSDLLKGEQKYTLLMPNDQVMGEFSEDLSELVLPENQAALADYIKAHMVDGKLLAQELTSASKQAAAGKQGQSVTVKSLAGTDIVISTADGALTINGAKVSTADMQASNGVMHVVSAPVIATTVFSVINKLPETSTLKAAIIKAKLKSTLRDPANTYTVLAPTNAAFEQLLKDLNLTADQLFADTTLLAQTLYFHVKLGQAVLAANFKNGESIITFFGERWIVKSTPNQTGAPTIEITDAQGNVAKVTQADLRARNGVVHVIDRVLRVQTKNIVEVAAANPDFSILVEAVTAAGLVDTLKGSGPLTVFAPTNAAFANLLAELNTTKDALFANKELLKSVLTYHVIRKVVFADQLSDDLKAATVQGQDITFKVGDGKASITDANGRMSNIVATNIQTINGTIHAIDKVILPNPNGPSATPNPTPTPTPTPTPAPSPATKDIVAIASSNPDFSILVEAVVAAGLTDTLKSAGPFTVFAPNNAAFAALLTELNVTKEALLANKTLLTSVLTYHVLSGKVVAEEITNGLAANTVQGQPIKFAINANQPSITDASGRKSNIIATDILATNGVVHAIDKVILPTSKNIVQIAQGNPAFSILVEAVVAAGLVDTLSGKGPFTVFAPTNDAFAALLKELNLTKEQLLADKALLTKVLTYHVAPAQVLSSQVPFELTVKSVQGDSLKVERELSLTDNVITLSDQLTIIDQAGRKAGVSATDIGATNGVVHVIDKVILPKL
jgi:transforming growth factor-beta-induced protein